MPALVSLGNALITGDELMVRATTGEFDRLREAAKDDPSATLMLSTGVAEARAFAFFAPEVSESDQPPYEPIGLGKPLTIEIQHVYTGDMPSVGFLGLAERDLLICSAVKPRHHYPAAPRAVNLIKEDVPDSDPIGPFPATLPGTPVVYHKPAMVDAGTNVTIELVADAFPQEAVNQVGNLMGQVAGLPVLAVGCPEASLLLMAGATLVKIVAKLGEALVDGAAYMADTLGVHFGLPGLEESQAGKIVFCDDEDEAELSGKYMIPPNSFELHSKADLTQPYRGRAPYVTVSLDGRQRPEYKDFEPTRASAEQLNRFFQAESGHAQIISALLDGARLANDLYYRDKILDLQKELGDLDPNSDEAKKLQKLIEAYKKNIVTDAFKQLT